MEHKPLLGQAAIAAAIKSGNVNIAGSMQVEILDLSEESRQAQVQHAETLRRFEAQQRARSVIVPTGIEEVKLKLRELGHPITIFGEGPADRRERLREVIAKLELSAEDLSKMQDLMNAKVASSATSASESKSIGTTTAAAQSAKEIFYSPASDALIDCRKVIAEVSFKLVQERLTSTKRIRDSDALQLEEDKAVGALYSTVKEISLTSSQFGDDRPLSCIKFSPAGNKFASGSLNPLVKVWDSSSSDLLLSLTGHSERITSVAWHPEAADPQNSSVHLASTSADGSCILWSLPHSSETYVGTKLASGPRTSDGSSSSSSPNGEGGMDMETVISQDGSNDSSRYLKSKLLGHQGIVSSCEFHPSGRYIGTAGHDSTWRLWDVESSQELLLQDGHIKECSTLSFQRDGALVLTGDWAGVALLWDLRSGQMIHAFQGHIKKIVGASFSPNGFQAATCSVDNMVRIWDLRKKKCGYALPAHANIISSVRYSSSGETLLTSSFDGTLKLWGSRDYRLLRVLSGHSGKVMACDLADDQHRVVSAGYDRTIKLWSIA